MKKIPSLLKVGMVSCVLLMNIPLGELMGQGNDTPATSSDASTAEDIRTPKIPDTPRVNGPNIFGVRPGSPFLYSIPATGQRPMQFSVDNLPAGLLLDANTGHITGTLPQAGEYDVTLHAKNALGAAEKKFRIVVGDQIMLTPAMGWNTWQCWDRYTSQDKVLKAAQAMASLGLNQHGWTYVNTDDGWQGKRGGEFNAIQPNENFPNIKDLADTVHALGLKIGIYSGPWITSYAGFCGGSSDNEDGSWQPLAKGEKNPDKMGKYSFAKQDAKQWAAWGIDYMKYDWNPKFDTTPTPEPETSEMADALKASGRDIVFSLSNSAKFNFAAGYVKLANSWRTTGDMRETWQRMISLGSAQVKWAPFAGPGHRNDPDMLVIGTLYANGKDGGHLTGLKHDEQYTHVTLWVLLGAPLVLGCDLDRMDPFTLGLITNDEVIDVDQDALGKQAVPVEGMKDDGKSVVVYAKPLENGTEAVGLLNETESATTVTVQWSSIGLSGDQPIRDLWRQRDLGTSSNHFDMQVASHGAELLRIGTPK